MADKSDIPIPEEFPYKAFISYSHKDREWAEWLHRELEHYRVPKRLIDAAGPGAAIPDKLFPVFLDRGELPASADLSAEIQKALRESAYLIVVCSPNSAASHWVDEEILQFKRLGREHRVLALIVEGEPNSKTAALECFPNALKYRIGADGELTQQPAEPIAADARVLGDGRENAKLKVAAGLLGVGFNALRQREVEARKARNRIWAAAVTSVLAVFFGVIAFFLVGQTLDANAAKFSAEASGDLAQRDYARAEIAAAKALTYRDTKEIRELLFAARLGGISTVARSGEAQRSLLNTFSRDGNVVATVLDGSGGGSVALSVSSSIDQKEMWHIDLPAAAGVPDSIAFSEPSGEARQMAVAWPDKGSSQVFHVGIWTLEPGKQPGLCRELESGAGSSLGRHTKRIPSLAFHPKQPWIATCGEEGKIALWDLSLDQPKLIWEKVDAHYPDVHGIAFNADGSLLGSGGGDYLAKVWKTSDMTGPKYDVHAPYKARTVEPLYTLTGHSDSVFTVAFSSDGHRIASGGYDRTIRIWDFNLKLKDSEGKLQPQTVATLSGNEGTVFALTFSDDGKLLASGSSDEAGRLWDASVGRLLYKFSPDNGIVRSVSLASFDAGIHVGGEHGWSVWSVRGGDLVHRLWMGGATVGAIAFDASGDQMAAGGNDGMVHVWDRSYNPLKVLDPQTPGEYINGLTFSRDGHWLAAAGYGEIVHVWDRTADWKKVTPPGKDGFKHDGPIWGLTFDPNGEWLASTNESHSTPQNVRLKRWNVKDWSLKDESERLDDQVYALAYDAKSHRLVTGDSRANVTVRDDRKLAVKDHVTNVKQGEVNVWSLAIAESPHTILSGNSDGHVYRWSPSDSGWGGEKPGERIATSDADARVNPTINSVAYNAKYGWVAAGGVGPSVEIYDVKTLHKIRSLKGHDGTIWWVTFDPQGTRLAYGGLDGIVRVIDLDRMHHLEIDTPEKLFEESQTATGLSVTGGDIVRTRH